MIPVMTYTNHIVTYGDFLMENMTLTIASDKIVEFRKMMDKFNTKAKKVDAEGIKVESMNKTVKKFNKQNFEVFEVTMSKPRFAIGNYQVDAVMTKEEGAELVFTFNGFEHDINSKVDYRRCDHCNVKHARKTVVQISENDKVMQVGKSCIKDYMGVSLSTFGWLHGMVDLFSDSEYWDIDQDEKEPRGVVVFEVSDVLAHTYDVCSVGGYKKVDTLDGVPSTASVEYLIGKCALPSDEGYAWAEKAIEIITNMLPTSDYEMNIQQLVKAEFVKPKRISLLVSSYVMVKRTLDALDENADSVSQYVGAEKERITFTGKIKTAYGNEGFYGYYVMYIIEDENGNELKWIATSDKHQSYAEGNTYKFTATVKKHEEYKGVKQTVITRGKAEKI